MKVLLLADPSACLRARVLRELMDVPEDDEELQELTRMREQDPLVTRLVALQNEDGSWTKGDGAWRGSPGAVLMTGFALFRLGTLGFGQEFEPVRRGAEFLYGKQRKDGAWPLRSNMQDEGAEGLTLSPLQTALPLRGLVSCGYAADLRSDKAIDWLMKYRLDDGAWPAGYVNDNLRGIAGYRRLAHSQYGCRSNTTAVLQCLAYRTDHIDEARRALDLLLGRETKDAHVFGFEVARTLGAEPVTGFLTFYARFDVGLMLDLAAQVGADRSDDRLAEMIEFVESLRGPYGLWEYAAQPQCSRWLTFNTLLALSRIDDHADWISFEPRTPFHPYPQRRDR